MLDIEIIRKETDKVREMLKKRNRNADILDNLIKIDNEWRKKMTNLQNLRQEQKKLSESRNIDEAKKIKELIKKEEEEIKSVELERYNLWIEIPNIPFDDVPVGKDESENIEIKKVGKTPKFDFKPKDHLELGENLGIIDTQIASEVSGSRFYYLKKAGAMLEFALINFAIKILTKNGFEPVIPPIMIRPEVYEKMGRLTESQKEERYYLEKDNMYLIGSAEHTLGPLNMNYVFGEKELPKRYVGFSTCLRREAGTYGKDTRGILRVHQFDKVEMYSFSLSEKSEEEHRFLLSMQEKMLSELEIPYRVVAICAGDMGPTDARQFDIEAWVPSQNKYREVGSCSNTTDYQTRGISAKIKRGDKTELAHALNATGIAIGRTIIAIMENNQNEKGEIKIPKALRKYMDCKYIKL